MNNKNTFNWKLFFILWASVVMGLIAVIPFSLALQAEQLQNIDLPMSLEKLIIIQVLINSIFFGLMTWIGLFLGKKYGLGLPFVENLLNREKSEANFKSIVLLSVIIGIILALLIAGLDLWIFNLESHGIEIPESASPAPWKGFLASFYGGITEEVLLRLFLLTLFIWIAMWICRNKTGEPTLSIFWTANILAAVIFGLAHLPATAALGIPLDGFVIARAIVLNGLGGVALGYLYFTRGLESAMIAHFSADIIMHVVL